MTKKEKDITQFQIFQILDEHREILDRHEGMLQRITLDVESVKEKVNGIYDLVVKISGNMHIDDQERVFMNNRLNNHEQRIAAMENNVI